MFSLTKIAILKLLVRTIFSPWIPFSQILIFVAHRGVTLRSRYVSIYQGSEMKGKEDSVLWHQMNPTACVFVIQGGEKAL